MVTNRKLIFIEEYLKCWNATESARRAGYSAKTAQVQGSRLLTDVMVRQAIDARLKDLQASADEVLVTLTKHKRGTLAPFLRQIGDEPAIDLGSDEAKENIDLIKSIQVTRRQGGSRANPWTEVKTKIEIHDPQAAAVQIGRIHGMFKDKVIADITTKIEYVNDWRDNPPADAP